MRNHPCRARGFPRRFCNARPSQHQFRVAVENARRVGIHFAMRARAAILGFMSDPRWPVAGMSDGSLFGGIEQVDARLPLRVAPIEKHVHIHARIRPHAR